MTEAQAPRRGKNPPRYAPLYFFLGYLTLTLLLAVFGPTVYLGFPILKTVIFIYVVMFMMVIGYRSGISTALPPTRPSEAGTPRFVRNLFDISLAVSLFTLGISITESFVSGTINTDVSAIGEAYQNAYEGYVRNTGEYSFEFIVYSFSLPFNFIAFVIGFYYFRDLGRVRSYSLVILVVASLLFYVLGSGKQKQLGDILIYVLTVAGLKYGTMKDPPSFRWIAGIGAASITALVGFLVVLGQRYSVIGLDTANVNRKVLDLIYIDLNHPIFHVFGNDAGLILTLFLSYLSQGYYGLGLALETDWDWTYFMGSSYSISVIGDRLFGLEWQWPNTLVSQVGLTTGWGASKWHTVFTHFATDFTFPGTALLFGFFAYVYAHAWLSAVEYRNPFAILMFALITMGAFFMPANNQLLHAPGQLFTTCLISFLYVRFAKYYNVAPAS